MDNCDSHSGSLWLPLALTCSLRLSLALSGSYWISPCLSLALYGSLWLPLWLSLALTATLWQTLALSSSLLLSNFAYTALDRLTGPLLDSHRRCHDDALPLWWRPTHPRPWSWTPPPPCQCRWTLCQDKQQNQWWQSPWQSWRWPFSPAPWSWHLEGGRGGLDKIKKGHKKLFPPLVAVPPMPSTAPLPWEAFLLLPGNFSP